MGKKNENTNTSIPDILLTLEGIVKKHCGIDESISFKGCPITRFDKEQRLGLFIFYNIANKGLGCKLKNLESMYGICSTRLWYYANKKLIEENDIRTKKEVIEDFLSVIDENNN